MVKTKAFSQLNLIVIKLKFYRLEDVQSVRRYFLGDTYQQFSGRL